MRTAHFLDGSAGKIFAYHRHAPACRAAVLMVQPLAEEMNKSRRMFSLLGEALLGADRSSLLVDPSGTGDSDGEFANACWHQWRADLDTAADYLTRHGTPVRAVVALRGGASLAAQWVAGREWSVGGPPKLVFWQPVVSGEAWLTQFLRLRSLAAKFAGRDEPVKALRARLAEGEVLEVGGYALNRDWTSELDAQRLARQPMLPGSMAAVFEVARVSGPEGPAGRALREAWPDARIETRTVAGETFWASQEITSAPDLVGASVAFLLEQ